MGRIQLSAMCVMVLGLVFAPAASAKNVILFLGDGMGISTVTAARIFAGQMQGASGEEHQLSFDKFNNVALIKTYNTDAQVPDSAGTISAILTGEKTRMGVLGVTSQVERGNCVQALRHELPTIVEMAEDAGFASGVISTARITHATPAGVYAHSPNRNWEDSSTIPDAAEAAGCSDIARQLVEFSHGDGVDVILGGGRAQFLPNTVADPEYPQKSGKRDDGLNLIQAWQNGADRRHYVWNQAGFTKLRPSNRQQYLGLFEPSHMQFEADRTKDPAGEPTLAAMTRFAINALARRGKGYFLLVEAGRIDHAHHFGNAYRALLDTVALDSAVEAALKAVKLDETLIIVTADHSHTLTISGYPARGNPILGKVGEDRLFNDPKHKPYTTLGYANGPGYKAELPDLSEVDTTQPNYQQLSTIPLPAETHAGEDVAAFATGLNSQAVRGVMEQNKLYQVMHDALFSTTR
jgi:alkaline phosphatase